MQIQWKLVFLIGLTVAGAVSAIIWKASETIVESKAGLIAETSERQLAPLRRLVQARLEVAKNQLVQFALRKESGSGAGDYGEFDAIGLVFADGREGKAWTPSWAELRPEARSARWKGGREQVLMRGLPYAKIQDGELSWISIRDKKDAGQIFALLVPVEVQVQAEAGTAAKSASAPALGAQALPETTTSENNISLKRGVVVGFFSENPLAAVSEDFIGSMHTVYVVDDKGRIASHSSRGFIGSDFSEDEVYKEIRSGSGRTFGAGVYDNLERQKTTARWERIEKTNLSAVIVTPLNASTDLSADIYRSLVAIALAAVGVTIAIASLLGRRPSGSPLVLRQTEEEIPEATDFEAREQRIPPAPQPGRSAAYRQMAQGLASLLREPVASVLGHAQLLRGKSDAAEIEAHTTSIERDTRQVKSIVDLLTRVAGHDDLELKPTSPGTVIDAVLASMDREFSVVGIKVEKNVQSTPLINASMASLRTAIAAICSQAIEAMRNRSEKKLGVRLYVNDGKIYLLISDSGIGFDREAKEHFFEPFYQPYQGAANPGLSLSMAHAILERHFADVSLESSPGAGTTVSLVFPASSVQGTSSSKAEAATAVVAEAATTAPAAAAASDSISAPQAVQATNSTSKVTPKPIPDSEPLPMPKTLPIPIPIPLVGEIPLPPSVPAVAPAPSPSSAAPAPAPAPPVEPSLPLRPPPAPPSVPVAQAEAEAEAEFENKESSEKQLPAVPGLDELMASSRLFDLRRTEAPKPGDLVELSMSDVTMSAVDLAVPDETEFLQKADDGAGGDADDADDADDDDDETFTSVDLAKISEASHEPITRLHEEAPVDNAAVIPPSSLPLPPGESANAGAGGGDFKVRIRRPKPRG